MRWSRPHTDTSLGELLCPDPGEPDGALLTAGEAPGEQVSETVADEGAGFLDEEDYLPQEHRGPGRLTVALVVALVLALGVLGGVWVQKQLGTSASAAGGQGFPGAAAGGQGFPGAAAGGQGFPGGAASGAPGGTGGTGGAGAGAPGSSSSTGARTGTTSGAGTTATPVVVGTVATVGARSLVVTDLGGTRHTVAVTSGTTVTEPYGHGALAKGDTVAVTGSTASDASVTATGITVS